MVEYVIDYLRLPEPHRFIFICLAAHDRQFDLAAFFSARTGNQELILTDHVTGGPADSALLAAPFIDNGSEVLIAYADCCIDFDLTDFLDHVRTAGADGAAVTYPSTGPMESYVEIDARGHILRSAEKVRISGTASGSLYYFREGRIFVDAARRMIAADRESNRESFVSPVFNELIGAGRIVLSYPITRAQRIEMGSPEDLAIARRWLVARESQWAAGEPATGDARGAASR